MSKSFLCNMKNILFISLVLCVVVNYCYGLSCLKCEASRPDSDCTLGKRMHKPRLQVCIGPNPKCYAVAKLDKEGNPLFQRGCTIRNICEEDGVEYCKVCKSQFCNYDVMDVEVEYIDE